MSYDFYDENYPYERDGVVHRYYKLFPKEQRFFDILTFLVDYFIHRESDGNVLILKASGTFKFIIGCFYFFLKNNELSEAQGDSIAEIYLNVRKTVVDIVIDTIKRDTGRDASTSKKRTLQ